MVVNQVAIEIIINNKNYDSEFVCNEIRVSIKLYIYFLKFGIYKSKSL